MAIVWERVSRKGYGMKGKEMGVESEERRREGKREGKKGECIG